MKLLELELEHKGGDEDEPDEQAEVFLELHRLDGTAITIYMDNIFWWAATPQGCEVFHAEAGLLQVSESHAQVTAAQERYRVVERCRRRR